MREGTTMMSDLRTILTGSLADCRLILQPALSLRGCPDALIASTKASRR